MRIIKENLLYHIFDYQVILVGMGPNNSFVNGFCENVAVNFPNVKQYEMEHSRYGDRSKYGTILPIEENGIIFCMCYMHDGGYAKKYNGPVYMNYEHLESCLKKVSEKYGNLKIASPIIGDTKYDGDGDKEKIISLFEKYFNDKDLDLYDYEPMRVLAELYFQRKKLVDDLRNYRITREEYEKERSRVMWQIRNGIFKPMPEDYVYHQRKREKYLMVKKSDIPKK